MERLVSDIARSIRSISGCYLGLVVTSNIRVLLGYEPLPSYYFTSTATIPALIFAVIIIPIVISALETYVPKFKKKDDDERWSPW